MDVKVPKRIQQQIAVKVERGECLSDGCQGKPVARGLCATCRAAAKSAIDSGRFTEDELIRRGLILPAQKAGRKPRNSFVKQLEEG